VALWHDDSDLKGRFHPQYPDDLQVLVHEGSFRFTDTKPEVMWLHILKRLTWNHKSAGNMYAYLGTVLNQPHQLKTVKLNDQILFVAKQGYKLPIRVTREYMDERVLFDVTPCDKCGLPELFDPILALSQKSFPTMNEEPHETIAFTSFCPLCGGLMLVNRSDHKS
jgi:hypothetical protein